MSIPCTDLALERRYLSALLVTPGAVHAYPLAASDLSANAHQAILGSMQALAARGEDINATSLRTELDRHGRLGSVGGDDALMALMDRFETDPRSCMTRLRELATQRRLREGAARLMAVCESGTLVEAREQAQAVHAEALGGVDDDPVMTFRAVLEATFLEFDRIAKGDDATSFTLGTPTIDSCYRAAPGDLIVVAAATNVGKSTLSAEWAISCAQRGIANGIISLEDPVEDLGGKAIGKLSGVNPEKFWTRDANRADWTAVTRAVDEHKGLPLFFKRISNKRLDSVLSTMATMVHVHRCRMLTVDYLQAIDHPPGSTMYERVHTSITRLTAAAQQLRVPLVLGSQLTKLGSGGEPQMRDCKDAGTIENSAQAGVMLWRESDQLGAPVRAKVAKIKRGAAGKRFELARSPGGMFVETEWREDVAAGGERWA